MHVTEDERSSKLPSSNLFHKGMWIENVWEQYAKQIISTYKILYKWDVLSGVQYQKCTALQHTHQYVESAWSFIFYIYGGNYTTINPVIYFI